MKKSYDSKFKSWVALEALCGEQTMSVLLVGMADCTEIAAKDDYKQVAAKLYERIIRNEKLKKSDIYALAIFRYAMSLWGTVPGQNKAYEYCSKYTEQFPNGRNYREAQFHTIRYLILNNRRNETSGRLMDFSRIDDGYTRYLNDLIKSEGEK